MPDQNTTMKGLDDLESNSQSNTNVNEQEHSQRKRKATELSTTDTVVNESKRKRGFPTIDEKRSPSFVRQKSIQLIDEPMEDPRLIHSRSVSEAERTKIPRRSAIKPKETSHSNNAMSQDSSAALKDTHLAANRREPSINNIAKNTAVNTNDTVPYHSGNRQERDARHQHDEILHAPQQQQQHNDRRQKSNDTRLADNRTVPSVMAKTAIQFRDVHKSDNRIEFRDLDRRKGDHNAKADSIPAEYFGVDPRYSSYPAVAPHDISSYRSTAVDVNSTVNIATNNVYDNGFNRRDNYLHGHPVVSSQVPIVASQQQYQHHPLQQPIMQPQPYMRHPRFDNAVKPPNYGRIEEGPVSKKIYLPSSQEYPDYDFMALIVGRRGVTVRKIEQESNARVQIRGKGKKNKSITPTPDDFDEPHVFITAEHESQLKRAEEMVQNLIIQGKNEFMQRRSESTPHSVNFLHQRPPPPPSQQQQYLQSTHSVPSSSHSQSNNNYQYPQQNYGYPPSTKSVESSSNDPRYSVYGSNYAEKQPQLPSHYDKHPPLSVSSSTSTNLPSSLIKSLVQTVNQFVGNPATSADPSHNHPTSHYGK